LPDLPEDRCWTVIWTMETEGEKVERFKFFKKRKKKEKKRGRGLKRGRKEEARIHELTFDDSLLSPLEKPAFILSESDLDKVNVWSIYGRERFKV